MNKLACLLLALMSIVAVAFLLSVSSKTYLAPFVLASLFGISGLSAAVSLFLFHRTPKFANALCAVSGAIVGIGFCSTILWLKLSG
jgi:hypothetical protein